MVCHLTTFYLAQEHCIAWQDQGAAPWPLPRWLPRESFWFRIRLHTMMQSVSIVYSRPTLLCELLRSVVHGLQIVNSVATPSVVSRANEIRQGWQLWMINFSTSHNHAEITPFSTVFVTCNPCGFTKIYISRHSSGSGWRVVGPMEGFGVRQALPEHNFHIAARHAASEAGGHLAHAGEMPLSFVRATSHVRVLPFYTGKYPTSVLCSLRSSAGCLRLNSSP